MDLKMLLLNRKAWMDPDFDPSTDDETAYRPWGFTIYRTEGCDRDWETLVETIHVHVRWDILTLPNPDEGDEEGHIHNTRTFHDIFRLDPRSDPVFYGKSMDEIRTLYDDPSAPGGVGMNAGPGGRRVFLLADRDVFDALRQGTFIVKCIEADWRWQERLRTTGNPPRVQPSYYGWFQLTTRAVAELWWLLYSGDGMEEIAPPLPRNGIPQTFTADYRL